MINDQDVLNDLRSDEGLKLKPYFDSRGILSIGYGRNLRDVGIGIDEANLMLLNDYNKAKSEVPGAIPYYVGLSPNRQRALVEMAFQMGIAGLLEFKDMLSYIKAGDYKLAGIEALNSAWAHQVPSRAARVAGLITNG